MTIEEAVYNKVFCILTDECMQVIATLPDERVIVANVPIAQLKTNPYALRLQMVNVAMKYLEEIR